MRIAEPAAYEPYVATTLNNLGIVYADTQRVANADSAYREALDIRRRLAKENPAAYDPYVSEDALQHGKSLRSHAVLPASH